jgi:hypothetical protein
VSGGFWSASTTLGLVAHVTWQGPPPQPNVAQQLPITLTLKLNTGSVERNYASQSTDASGYFSSSTASLVGGAYNWRVKGPKYLANAGTVTLGGSGTVTSTLEMGLMRAGDADDDNLVSASDFNILRATFGKACGDVGYDDRADFTGNCLVDASDFNVLRANFGTSGAPPLRPAGP